MYGEAEMVRRSDDRPHHDRNIPRCTREGAFCSYFLGESRTRAAFSIDEHDASSSKSRPKQPILGIQVFDLCGCLPLKPATHARND
jgi:hypothetical protein